MKNTSERVQFLVNLQTRGQQLFLQNSYFEEHLFFAEYLQWLLVKAMCNSLTSKACFSNAFFLSDECAEKV